MASSRAGSCSRLGIGRSSITWRLKSGRLHPVGRGVYAVGRPELSRHGRWMAAVLACGPGAVLSHGSAAALWGFEWERLGAIEVSVTAERRCRRPGLGIVVEADGLRYHRTGSQQTRALRRDQAHVSAGMLPLRFSHWQVKHEPAHVRGVLRKTAAHARAGQPTGLTSPERTRLRARSGEGA